MNQITYKRPSGTEITVGDTPANRELADQRGWVEKKKAKPKAKAKQKAK